MLLSSECSGGAVLFSPWNFTRTVQEWEMAHPSAKKDKKILRMCPCGCQAPCCRHGWILVWLCPTISALQFSQPCFDHSVKKSRKTPGWGISEDFWTFRSFRWCLPITRSNEILLISNPSFNLRFISVSHDNYDFLFSGGAEFHYWTEIHQSHFSGTIDLVLETGSNLKPGQSFTWVGEMRCKIWAWPTSGGLFWSW